MSWNQPDAASMGAYSELIPVQYGINQNKTYLKTIICVVISNGEYMVVNGEEIAMCSYQMGEMQRLRWKNKRKFFLHIPTTCFLGPLLMTWFNCNLSMDK